MPDHFRMQIVQDEDAASLWRAPNHEKSSYSHYYCYVICLFFLRIAWSEIHVVSPRAVSWNPVRSAVCWIMLAVKNVWWGFHRLCCTKEYPAKLNSVRNWKNKDLTLGIIKWRRSLSKLFNKVTRVMGALARSHPSFLQRFPRWLLGERSK